MFALLLFAQLSIFQPASLGISAAPSPAVLGESTQADDSGSVGLSTTGRARALRPAAPSGAEVGRLRISKGSLVIDAPIISGVEWPELARGFGHHRETPLPGQQGNSGIACHRWYPGANPNYTLCLYLDQLQVGDKIEVIYSDRRYVFEVEWVKVVAPHAVEVLNPTDYAALTLYTCTPVYTATERLVYRARLVSRS